MADEHDHGADRPEYDPTDRDLPEREPPLRSTAPQSDYTMRDVGVGFAVFAVGLVLTFGLALGLV
ncbi:MAG: hypothetical protein V5A44_13450 [Haloarculaceae archaeon]